MLRLERLKILYHLNYLIPLLDYDLRDLSVRDRGKYFEHRIKFSMFIEILGLDLNLQLENNKIDLNYMLSEQDFIEELLGYRNSLVSGHRHL